MAAQYDIAQLCCRLDAGLVTTHELQAGLASRDAVVVHASVLHLAKRLRAADGDSWALPGAEDWASWLPQDLFALPSETQCVLAELALDGFALARSIVNPPLTLPPLVRLAWLRAALLERPELLDEYQQTPLGWEAVRGLPCERVIGSGLLGLLVTSRQLAVRRLVPSIVRAGLERGLLACSDAQALVVRLAHDANAVIALEALRLLQQPWTFALALPQLNISLDLDLALGREVLEVYARRGAAAQLRRVLTQGVPEALLSELLGALARVGEGHDVGLLVECARLQWPLCGAAAIEGLVVLKRRAMVIDEEHARAVLELFLAHPAVTSACSVAEVLSSRGDVVVRALDLLPAEPAALAASVALLEALGTRSAIERLRRTICDSSERAGWRYAIGALARLGIRDAEVQILARLDDAPYACLDALRHVGGARTAQVLCERLTLQDSSGASSAWLMSAALLAFRLDPSEQLLEALAARGLLSAEILERVPEFGSSVRSRVLSELALCAGDSRRAAAIAALGRTGGPTALAPLSELLSDADAVIREHALAALRVLGRRLAEQRAAVPACLESSSEPSNACVADALVGRLRTRPLAPEVLVRLLEPLAGLSHPALVVAVRPHLRNKSPEVRKRALACLAAAGPEAAAWVLPWVSSTDATVARQAIRALMQTRAAGVAQPVARWLDSSNMNLKKTAAEALATLGDASVVAQLLQWLGAHDNPGFRQLLSGALEAILGASYCAVLLDALVYSTQPRQTQLLIEGLSAKLTATDIAALIAVRAAGSAPWAEQLLQNIHAGVCTLRAGTLAELEHELRRRGLAQRVPEPEQLREHEAAAQRLRAARAGQRLALALQRSAAEPERRQLSVLLEQANVHGQMLVPRLSRTQVHTLLSAYPALDAAGKAGARHVLSLTELEPVARLCVAQLVAEEPLPSLPTGLLRCVLGACSASVARAVLNHADRHVQTIARNVLLLEPAEIELHAWAKHDASVLFARLLEQDAIESCFEWARQQRQLPALLRAVERRQGSAACVALARRWLELQPQLASILVPELIALGSDADTQLERVVAASDAELGLRSAALSALLQRPGRFAPEAICEALLGDTHAVLREHAGRWLWTHGEPRWRAFLLRMFLAGSFRQEFRLQLEHRDLAELDAQLPSADGERCVELLRGVSHDAQIPRLLQLWRTSKSEARQQARDALRSLDANAVLLFVRADLEAADETVLEVVGQCTVIGAWLVECCRCSATPERWLVFFERMAGAGMLHAPGLCDLLCELLGEAHRDAALLRCILRCDDWSRPQRCSVLLPRLTAALAGPRRRELLTGVIAAIQPQDGRVRLHILGQIGLPADAPVVLALLDLVLADPSLRSSLSAAMDGAVEQAMRAELDGPPERVRRIVSHLAATAASDTERAELVELLERCLRHTSPRVRSHAHRLLRTHAERTRYLEATMILLESPDPTTLRGAIRTLAFGRHLAALPQLARLVFHANSSARSAASDGLRHLLRYMGDEARAALIREMNHARPDRRSALAALLDEHNVVVAADTN